MIVQSRIVRGIFWHKVFVCAKLMKIQRFVNLVAHGWLFMLLPLKGTFSNLIKTHNTFCIEIAHAWCHFVARNRQ